MNNVELARTLSWRELEIANTELGAKWKGKTHFSRNEKERTDSAKRRNAHAPPSAQFLPPCALHSRRTA